MKKTRLKGLSPAVDDRSRILILGSFPGPESLAKRQYYAYPRNQFWRFICDLIDIEMPVEYRDKIKALKDNRISLWDVIKSCRRHKASDGNICDPIYNDIVLLLERYPGIKAVFCNGNKSYSVCHKLLKDIDIPIILLPSTSPAYASISYGQKKRRWKKILNFLK